MLYIKIPNARTAEQERIFLTSGRGQKLIWGHEEFHLRIMVNKSYLDHS